MKTFACALAAVALLISSPCVFAKSRTAKIEVAGPAATPALEISDVGILKLFSIWNGPGVRINGERQIGAQPGAFIDWSRGTASRPSTAQLYTVTFHQEGGANMDERHRKYVVTYAFDSDGQGYIYLPGPQDGELYARNTFSIVHNVEGSWFHASPNWEQAVAPRIRQHLLAN